MTFCSLRHLELPVLAKPDWLPRQLESLAVTYECSIAHTLAVLHGFSSLHLLSLRFVSGASTAGLSYLGGLTQLEVETGADQHGALQAI